MNASTDSDPAEDGGAAIDEADSGSAAKVLADASPRIFESVEIELEARLGKVSMTVKDLLELEKGAVVALDRSVGDPVDLRLNDRPVARGEIVTVQDNFAIRITELLDVE